MAKWFNIVDKAEEESADIFIYGAIVDDGWKWYETEITPMDFKTELDKTKDRKTLNLYVNSPGGNVFAGMAIYHMLDRHSANKIGHVDGIAASISSVILMACNKILCPKTAMMLVHKPMGGLLGYFNADQLLEIASELDKVQVPIVEAYIKKTGMKSEKIIEVMKKNTYMTAQEAVDNGFADGFDEGKNIKASIDGDTAIVNGQTFDLKNFKDFPVDKFKNVFVKEEPKKEPKKVAVDYSYFENKLKFANTF
jgi:ATP-dependent Clp protease protease subunit